MTEEKSSPDNLQLNVSGTKPPFDPTQESTNQFRQRMVSVPGFTSPVTSKDEKDNLCPLPSCSQEDINEFRSAGVLLKALAAEARAWSEQLPKDFRPAIMALLHGNMQVEVRRLTQVSFDGIKIEGMIGESPCSVLAHQDTVQLMCYAVSTVEEEEEFEAHPIGFIWPGHDESI